MISGSVGSGGKNHRQDVVHVQQLLNTHIPKLAPLRPLLVSGMADPPTVAAIKEFQRRIVGMNSPDGRVDPNGRTLAALGNVGGASPGLQRHLEAAKRAVAYVKQKVHVGASNKLADIFLSRGESLGCVLGSRISQQLINAGFSNPEWAKGKLHIEILALGTEKASCGNCGEQAAVAFVYLWKQLGVRPIDYMHWTNGDHAFVVIGRKRGLASNVASWGPEAVVCDPWEGKAYPATEIEMHMKGRTFDSMLPVE